MKATIYTEDGQVDREIDFNAISGYGKDMTQFRGAGVITNQPFVINHEVDDCPEGDGFSLLTFTVGNLKRKFRIAGNHLVFLGNRVFSFYDLDNNRWVTVCGQVLVEDMNL